MHTFRDRARRWGKGGFILVSCVYVVMLAVYLLARWLIGDTYWQVSFTNTFAHWFVLPSFVLLPSALLMRMKRVAAGLLPIAAIGSVWLAPYFVPKVHPTPEGKTIRALSLNVWGNNHDLHRIESWIRDSGADVVMLQEVSPAYATGVLPNLMESYPYQSSQPDPSRWGDNMTLSRYPIISSDYLDLGIPDNPSPLRLVIDTPAGRIAVYNVHLAWPGGQGRTAPGVFDRVFQADFYLRNALNYNENVRNLQIERLLDIWAEEPYPIIVGGDFNMSAASLTYNTVAAELHDTFREAGWGMGTSWPVAAARGLPAIIPPLVRIDYIWHSDGLRTVNAWQGPAVGSDHLPIVADMEMIAPVAAS